MEVWLPFMMCRIYCILRTLLSGWSFLFMIIHKLWSHCSHCKHDLHNYRVDEWPTPSSREMITIADHDNNIYIEWHNNSINGNREKYQSLLLKEIGSGPGPSSLPSMFLFLTWSISNPVPIPLSWPTITKQIQDPCHFHAYRPLSFLQL